MLTTALMLRCVCKLYVCLRPEWERERESAMCFPCIIKHNFVAKTWTRSVKCIVLFTVFICLTCVVVGFGYFSVIRPVK